MLVLSLVQEASSLSVGHIVSRIPTDPASIFAYVLVVASVIGVWRLGRPGKPPPADPKG